MGTNYYRIPTAAEMEKRKDLLQTRIRTMDMSPANLEKGMGYMDDPQDPWTRMSPWDEFIKDSNVHLGKRSGGWKFCWNFHKDKYYNSKESLIKFVLSGRIVDEYGTEIGPQEFLDMAFSWCTDGWDNQTYYKENPSNTSWFHSSNYDDIYVDGLRISNSTDFC